MEFKKTARREFRYEWEITEQRAGSVVGKDHV